MGEFSASVARVQAGHRISFGLPRILIQKAVVPGKKHLAETRNRVGLSDGAETDRISYMEEIPDIPGVDPKLLRDPVFRRVLEDALAIQDRFSAEPVYSRTGKGYLKPTGVEEIREAKEKMKGENGTSLVREDP
jgi:hypothetical protein